MLIINFLVYLLLVGGVLLLINAYFTYKELKNTKEEKEIIKEIKVCPADLTENEKENKIKKFLDAVSGEITKREVKDDGYLYITIKTTNIKKLKSDFTNSLLMSFVLMVLFVILNNILNNDGRSSYKKEDTSSNKLYMQQLAYNYCKDWVKERLKTPSTANFPFTPLKVIKEDGSYYVYSYVDAQNSFGAEIRTKFICVTKCNEHSCSFVDLQFKQ